mmetsp:Transcript_2587/g.9955  ORF Transcript_2587/g.9955 Transcript_2587/m.9955 type:complete len:318 (-) Transcript_2587:32-985(-)
MTTSSEEPSLCFAASRSCHELTVPPCCLLRSERAPRLRVAPVVHRSLCGHPCSAQYAQAYNHTVPRRGKKKRVLWRAASHHGAIRVRGREPLPRRRSLFLFAEDTRPPSPAREGGRQSGDGVVGGDADDADDGLGVGVGVDAVFEPGDEAVEFGIERRGVVARVARVGVQDLERRRHVEEDVVRRGGDEPVDMARARGARRRIRQRVRRGAAGGDGLAQTLRDGRLELPPVRRALGHDDVEPGRAAAEFGDVARDVAREVEKVALGEPPRDGTFERGDLRLEKLDALPRSEPARDARDHGDRRASDRRPHRDAPSHR